MYHTALRGATGPSPGFSFLPSGTHTHTHTNGAIQHALQRCRACTAALALLCCQTAVCSPPCLLHWFASGHARCRRGTRWASQTHKRHAAGGGQWRRVSLSAGPAGPQQTTPPWTRLQGREPKAHHWHDGLSHTVAVHQGKHQDRAGA